MNEKFNKNAKVEQLTNMFFSTGEEKGLIVKDPLCPRLELNQQPLTFQRSALDRLATGTDR